VTVADHGHGVPRLREPAHDGGRGLLLVDRICRDWGVRDDDDGKTVWGHVPCTEA
jgi:hypothetical protein